MSTSPLSLARIPLAGCLALLLALTSAGACVTPGAVSAPDASASGTAADTTMTDLPTADVSVIREPAGGAVVFVSFRTETAVAISPDRALRVETPTGDFEAPIEGAPQRAAEGAAVRSSAEYRLAEAGVQALDAAGERARVAVHDGQTYRTYAVHRADLLE